MDDHASPYHALRIPAFRWYIVSTLAASFASEIQSVAVGWQIYQLTNDPLALGLIGLAGAVPFLTTVLFAGHVADIANRKVIAGLALVATALCSLFLMTVSYHGLVVEHQWLIYAAIMGASLARSFLTPARGALVAEIVPESLFEASTRMRTACFQLGQVVGRSGSGFIYAAGLSLGFGAAFSYAVSGGLLLLALVALLMMAHTPAPRHQDPEPVLASLGSGLRQVTGQPILLGAMVLDFVGVLFGDAIALLPIFAHEVLAVGPEGLGILRAMPAVGAVAMAILLTNLPPFRHAGRALLCGMAGFGLSMIGFGLSTSFALSLVLLAISGAMDYISVVVRGTLVQVLTPRHLLGRVTAVQHIFIGAGNEIGSFESGAAARLMGLVPSVVFGGVVTLGVVGGVAKWCPSLRKLGSLRDLKPVTSEVRGPRA